MVVEAGVPDSMATSAGDLRGERGGRLRLDEVDPERVAKIAGAAVRGHSSASCTTRRVRVRAQTTVSALVRKPAGSFRIELLAAINQSSLRRMIGGASDDINGVQTACFDGLELPCCPIFTCSSWRENPNGQVGPASPRSPRSPVAPTDPAAPVAQRLLAGLRLPAALSALSALGSLLSLSTPRTGWPRDRRVRTPLPSRAGPDPSGR